MCARGNPQSGVRWHPAVPGHLSQLIKPPQELSHVSSSEVPSGTHILKSATSACDSGSYSLVPCGNRSVLTFIIGFHFLEQRVPSLASKEGMNLPTITPSSWHWGLLFSSVTLWQNPLLSVNDNHRLLCQIRRELPQDLNMSCNFFSKGQDDATSVDAIYISKTQIYVCPCVYVYIYMYL